MRGEYCNKKKPKMVNAPEGFFLSLLFFKFVIKEHDERPHWATAAVHGRNKAEKF